MTHYRPRMAVDVQVLAWMLDSDPALRWQVERDLAGAPEEVWRATRGRMRTEGFAARLMAEQDADGRWAGGAFFPADFDFAGPEAAEGQPWTATTWTLNALREWGLPASFLGDTADRLAASARWEYDDLPYWGGEVDCCINAYTLANGAWLRVDVGPLAEWFVEHAMAGGGWNREWVEGSTRSSFHSTLNSVQGLLAWERITGGTQSVRSAREAGEEYLLQRRLLVSLRTGLPPGPWTTRFVHPFRWTYSALKAVDHFRTAALLSGAAPDPRLRDAVEVVRAARGPDGRWRQEGVHPGRTWFEVDAPPGEPSRWLTFFGTRVLEWWDGTTTAD